MPKPRADSSATLMMNGSSASNILCEGYMLKKKRKKMQGMARRYFCLSSTGTLSYSFHPNSPIRDSILVSLAFVYASRKQRVFHIDSGRTVMHCKALTEADFDSWTIALRGFIAVDPSAVGVGGSSNTSAMASAREGSPALMTGGRTFEEESEDEDADQGEGEVKRDLAKLLETVIKMALPLQELDGIHLELKSGEGGAPFQHMTSTSSFNASSSPSQKFKFLKKGSQSKASPGLGDDYFESKPTPDALVRQLGQSLSHLKAQHDQLTSLIPALAASLLRQEQLHQFQQQQHHLQLTRPSSALANLPHSSRYPSRAHSTAYGGNGSIHGGSRASSFSMASEETEEYYEDARTGIPGEFFLKEEEEDREKVLEEEDEGEEDDEYGDDEEIYEEDAYEEDETRKIQDEVEARGAVGDQSTTMMVERRKALPAPASGEEFSMLGMLRKNVGKDLSTISFPVTFNEPLSALQRIAEELEYSELLHRAAQETDSIERLVLVATFAVTGAVGNKFRSSRKPFNPLLGETYECIRPDKGLKFISEKVSHHPPIMAFHAESTVPPPSASSSSASTSTPAWSIDGHVAPSQKFWGMSFELMFPGQFKVRFSDNGDCFEVQKPSSFVKNLVAGTKYLEIIGESIISNTRTGDRAVLDFKEGSSWSGASGRNKIEGKVFDATGKLRAELVGRWDECVDRKKGGKEFNRIWEANGWDKNPARYYGFSPFSLTLNEVTPIEATHLPSSDSRLRPDQLALERGEIDVAEEEKKRVEEKQREKRKAAAAAAAAGGAGYSAQFFASEEGDVGEGEAHRKQWSYKGDYFEKRAAGTLVDVDIF